MSWASTVRRWLGGWKRIHAARPRHKGREFVQGLDLIAHDAPHLRGCGLCLLRERRRMALEFGARRLKLLLDVRRRRAQLADGVAEPGARFVKRPAHFGRDL